MISIKNVILLNKPLSDFELEDAARGLKISSSGVGGGVLTRYITEKAE